MVASSYLHEERDADNPGQNAQGFGYD